MAVRYFVRIFQQGGCRPGLSAPAEGSTCLAKGLVGAAFLRGVPLSCPRAASFPYHLPGFLAKPWKGPDILFPLLSWPERQTGRVELRKQAPESCLAWILMKQLQEELAAGGSQ